MNKLNLAKIDTEQRNANSMDIDRKSTFEILEIINNEDKIIADAINNELDGISKCVDKIYESLKNNGRLIYVGAGSSGRIAVLDASEMLPTYGVGEDKIIAILAGGDHALRNPVEGAEDDEQQAIEDLKKLNLTKNDVVLAIAASGRTPYALSAMRYAKQQNALPIGLCMTKNPKMLEITDDVISIITGSEVVTGSTRMKAGTATKMVCNMISTAVMIKLGKVYQNLMVDVKASNEKLINRAISIVKQVTNENDDKVKEILEKANYSCKHAIVMIKNNIDYKSANELLIKFDGKLSEII